MYVVLTMHSCRMKRKGFRIFGNKSLSLGQKAVFPLISVENRQSLTSDLEILDSAFRRTDNRIPL